MPNWISVRTPDRGRIVTSRAPFDAATTDALVRAARSVKVSHVSHEPQSCVYVILLEFAPGQHGLYVGLTGLTPDERYINHKTGHKASRWPRRFGVGLLPALYRHLNPMARDVGTNTEVALAMALAQAGIRVKQA